MIVNEPSPRLIQLLRRADSAFGVKSCKFHHPEQNFSHPACAIRKESQVLNFIVGACNFKKRYEHFVQSSSHGVKHEFTGSGER